MFPKSSKYDTCWPLENLQEIHEGFFFAKNFSSGIALQPVHKYSEKSKEITWNNHVL